MTTSALRLSRVSVARGGIAGFSNEDRRQQIQAAILASHALKGRLVRTAPGEHDVRLVAADVCRGLGLRSNKGSYGHHVAKIDTDDKVQLAAGPQTPQTPEMEKRDTPGGARPGYLPSVRGWPLHSNPA